MTTEKNEQSLSTELEILKPEIEKVLPTHVTADKFMRVVMTSIAQSPGLRNADRRTLLTSCVKAATDGLMPDGREAALVIFRSGGKELVQYMPMIAGILKKVRNSGELKSIMSNVVYEKDKFRYWVDDSGEHILHEPNVLEADRGGFLACYAIAETKDGGFYCEVMSRSQVNQVKDVSRAKNGPWKDWFDEMARKTVVRRLSKRLPMSTDLLGVITADDNLYDLNRGAGVSDIKAIGGISGAKAALGLPQLPDDDYEDAEAPVDEGSDDGQLTPGNVDQETGEVIEGKFNEESAIKRLEAKRTLKTLDEEYDAVIDEFRKAHAGGELPDELGIKYQELRESLTEREKV
jgi:recombination protein RecT